nr:hypothetical protein [Candidatus Sigynarchaeota archaeon]
MQMDILGKKETKKLGELSLKISQEFYPIFLKKNCDASSRNNSNFQAIERRLIELKKEYPGELIAFIKEEEKLVVIAHATEENALFQQLDELNAKGSYPKEKRLFFRKIE